MWRNIYVKSQPIYGPLAWLSLYLMAYVQLMPQKYNSILYFKYGLMTKYNTIIPWKACTGISWQVQCPASPQYYDTRPTGTSFVKEGATKAGTKSKPVSGILSRANDCEVLLDLNQRLNGMKPSRESPSPGSEHGQRFKPGPGFTPLPGFSPRAVSLPGAVSHPGGHVMTK